MLNIRDLRLNNAEPSLCTPVTGLEMSWKLDSDNRGVLQTAYAASIVKVGCDTPVWTDKGSNKSIHIPVETTLESRTDYTLTVTVTDNFGEKHFNSLSVFQT